MLNKKIRIQRCFNKASKTYDNYGHMPIRICKELLSRLKTLEKESAFDHETIVDFACGTGISTREINSTFSYKNLYAIDFCDSLLDEARKKVKNSNVMFILADFDDFLFSENSIHFIFCNMGLQWSLNLKNTFAIFFHQLIRSGIMAFSIPLEGTFNELGEKSRNRFYQTDTIVNLLTTSGFSILSCQERSFSDTFDTIQEALRSIKYIGANCLIQRRKFGLSKKPILQSSCADKKSIALTYHIGFFVCKKI
ncbi:methyltransferase domain-containing protein [Coxiella endosymbiont of Amblyomma sculptum]|uniref:methyltransferase domain-containing protein n=1 Tax=Coxiella endosymbiont of Amblyomma sculptum TaxID=2487929 RepID=UPI00132EF9B0|nr:methyltransferase domain-containing protein [Coxiella endosymbiont of Amblyomma sculptum]QHG92594.1 methyltransferase domain-containing protein [Coxiella endosymbiont of Amblyomma sculptum]